MYVPDLSKYPDFEKLIKKKDKFILDENNNAIPADLMEWSDFFENELEKRIVKQDEVKGKWISTVFLGIDHNFGFFDSENHNPLIFETMVFNSRKGGSEVYCKRYATWKESEKGHNEAIQWVNNGCKDEGMENE
jgi:hypothetical protein